MWYEYHWPVEPNIRFRKWLVAVVDNVERLAWGEQEYRDAWNAEFPDDPIEP